MRPGGHADNKRGWMGSRLRKSRDLSRYRYIEARIEELAHVAQVVEHVLGKDEVSGSSPLVSSRRSRFGKINRTLERGSA